MAIEDYFNTEFNAMVTEGISDDMGGRISSSKKDFSFMGMVDLLSGYKGIVAAQFVDKATHILMCPINTPITTKQIIDDGSSRWRILNIDNPTQRSHHLEAILEYLGISNV